MLYVSKRFYFIGLQYADNSIVTGFDLYNTALKAAALLS